MDSIEVAQKAIDRISDNAFKGTGCKLSNDECAALLNTIFSNNQGGR